MVGRDMQPSLEGVREGFLEGAYLNQHSKDD